MYGPIRLRYCRPDNPVQVKPDTVNVGDTIRVKPGERVPLDGTLSGKSGATFDLPPSPASKPRIISAKAKWFWRVCVSADGLVK
ncbi:MAG: hypothetical protein IPL27_03560 [Lewinellaceae bacterium]|nr:hypothetical protein [Lewinellaceae bacterium]